MEEGDCLQQATTDWLYPHQPLEVRYSKQICQGTPAALGDDVERVAVLEGIENISDVWMAQMDQL